MSTEAYDPDELDPLDALDIAEQRAKAESGRNTTVDTTKLNGAEAAAYFEKVDRRILIGFRAALELLGLPLPAYAVRRPPGPLNRLVREVAQVDGEHIATTKARLRA